MAFLDKEGLEHLTSKLILANKLKIDTHRGTTVEEITNNLMSEFAFLDTEKSLSITERIEKTVDDISDLKDRVTSLETVYDSYFTEHQHKLFILGSDYDLEVLNNEKIIK